MAALVAAGSLASCSSEIGSSGNTGFVAGKGIITTLKPAERKDPGPVAGKTIDGKPISLSDFHGKTVVVNVWGSWCAPCRAEAPMLAAASRDMGGKGVAFLGINSRDLNQSAARAFVRTYDVPYPSIYDQQGETLLAFRGTLPPDAIPSTVIIDPQGRVAASVIGEISRATLYGLVDDVAPAKIVEPVKGSNGGA